MWLRCVLVLFLQLVEVEEAEELKESADIVALGVFHDTASAEAKAFRAAATGHKLVQAAYTSDPALAAVFGGSKVCYARVAFVCCCHLYKV